MPGVSPSDAPAKRVVTPDARDVAQALDRVLDSQDFHSSDKRRRLLQYVVEETLAGRTDHLKGYTIALEVFDRDGSFDAQSDPVVRIEMRRLRRDLDGYYAGAGAHDPVRLSIPKGAYIATFEWSDTGLSGMHTVQSHHEEVVPAGEGTAPPDTASPAAGAPQGRLRLALVVVLAAVIVASALGVTVYRRYAAIDPVASNEPVVVILPFEARDDTAETVFLAKGIGEDLIGDLMRFPGFRLYGQPLSFGTTGESAAALRKLGAVYTVRGNVRVENGSTYLKAYVEDARTGEILWSDNFVRDYSPKDLMSVQDDLAGEVATVLGQTYGVLYDDMTSRSDGTAVKDMESYFCLLRANAYRRSFARDEYPALLQCLGEAVRKEPQSSDALAMLGWLHMDAGRFDFVPADRRAAEYEIGYQAANKALSMSPNSVLAVKALSSITYYMGRYDESERLARRALELNPYDPDTLAQLGWRLAARGRFDEGIPLLEKAVSRSVNPPGWYFHLLALDRLMQGDYEKMLEYSERSTVDFLQINLALVAISANEMCQHDKAQDALRQMARYPAFDKDPGGQFRRHGATEDIVAAVERGIQRAREGKCD